ncbi:MAG TPA: glycosyltransferase, partial [Candidatus Limnocylindria bacterium]|nr:glycosyltransferase [Candidatus Limnocylindria bacterium]
MNELPPEIAAILDERSEARQARDWKRADALRDRLHQLGWEPVDSPSGSTARPRPSGAAAGVGYLGDQAGSLLDEPPTLGASVVVVADEQEADVTRFLDGMRRHPPAIDWEMVLVANAPSFEVAAGDELPATAVSTSARVGWADAANLGMRRTRGAVIVLADTSLEPTGDWLTPLHAAFEDPTVGIAADHAPWTGDAHR